MTMYLHAGVSEKGFAVFGSVFFAQYDILGRLQRYGMNLWWQGYVYHVRPVVLCVCERHDAEE